MCDAGPAAVLWEGRWVPLGRALTPDAAMMEFWSRNGPGGSPTPAAAAVARACEAAVLEAHLEGHGGAAHGFVTEGNGR